MVTKRGESEREKPDNVHCSCFTDTTKAESNWMGTWGECRYQQKFSIYCGGSRVQVYCTCTCTEVHTYYMSVCT